MIDSVLSTLQKCKNVSPNDQNNLVWTGAYKNNALIFFF